MSLPFASREEITAAQHTTLNALLREIARANPFYLQRLREAHLIDFPVDLETFRSRLPYTTKADIARDQELHPPYGTNLTYPLDHYVRLHQTSSTTGAPLRWLDTKDSWQWMIRSWTEVLSAAGVTRDDVVFAAFSFGPFIGFWLAFEAAMSMGCLCIPGGAMNSATRLRAIIANRATVLCATPTYAIRLGELAREEHLDLAAAHIKIIIVAGEPGGSVPAVRQRIEQLWPTARVFDHHGMTEVGPVTFECPARPGVLHIIEEAYLAEVIDLDTAHPVEHGSGALGELVLTTLGRTGSPLLRYRTGDLVRPGPLAPLTPCACGRSTMTLEGGIVDRADDMIFVRGVNLFPSAIDGIIHRERGIGEYRVEIDERGSMTELRILIEPTPAFTTTTNDLEARLTKSIRDAFNLRIPIILVEPNTLPRFEMKSQRWIRLR